MSGCVWVSAWCEGERDRVGNKEVGAGGGGIVRVVRFDVLRLEIEEWVSV